MDRFITVSRTGLSGSLSTKRKTPDNAWLEHVEIMDNICKNGMSVKCVHCKLILKGSTCRLKAHIVLGSQFIHFRTCELFESWRVSNQTQITWQMWRLCLLAPSRPCLGHS